MPLKRWIWPGETKQADELAAAGIQPLTARVLASHGIGSPNEARRFLSTEGELHDPFLMKGMEQAVALIEGALSFLPAAERKEAVKKSCQRTFQALRIDVNSESEALYAFLVKLPHVLKPGGRAAILTFHSGEDRLVKQAFRQQYRDGLYSDIAQEVTRPSPQECRRNPRAHSTKLRWAVRAE